MWRHLLKSVRRDTARLAISLELAVFPAQYLQQKHTFYCCVLILVRTAQMFPGTRWFLWESSGVGNLTQPLITHILLLLFIWWRYTVFTWVTVVPVVHFTFTFISLKCEIKNPGWSHNELETKNCSPGTLLICQMHQAEGIQFPKEGLFSISHLCLWWLALCLSTSLLYSHCKSSDHLEGWTLCGWIL